MQSTHQLSCGSARPVCRGCIDEGADVNARDLWDSVPLYYACKTGEPPLQQQAACNCMPGNAGAHCCLKYPSLHAALCKKPSESSIHTKRFLSQFHSLGIVLRVTQDATHQCSIWNIPI